MIHLFVLARNQTKGLDLRSPTGSGVRKAGPRETREAVGKGRRRGAVDNGQQKRPVGAR